MTLKTKKVGNYTVKVDYDNDATSPREWDDLSTIYSNHSRINPDNHSIDELLDDEHNLKIEGLVALKVWLFEHGAYAFQTTELDEGDPFGNGMFAQFDSGVFGVIAMPIETAKKEWDGDDWEEKAKHWMKCAIDEYDKYAKGEVFHYYIENNNGELVDSCGGYYDMEEAMNDAIETAKDYNEADEQEAKDILENGTLEQLTPKFYELATETREEQIRQAADTFGKWGDGSRDSVSFECGAEWADSHPREGLWNKEKVTQWLKENFEHYAYNYGIDEVIVGLTKAMETES